MSIWDDLADHAGRPFEAGRMLPLDAYQADEVLAAEHARLFSSEWICVARTIELAEVGDYVVGEIPSATGGAREVVVVRGDDGEVRAFDNVCPHRLSPLLAAGCGHESRITCPYHAWAFRLDGSLIGAPYMNTTVDVDGRPFDPADYALTPLAVEIWEGFVFVNQSASPTPLAPRLAGLSEIVGRFQMAGYVPVHRQVDVWATNWKLMVENFMDAYHVFKVHRNSFGVNGDNTTATQMFPGTDAWAHHIVVHHSEEGSGSAHPSNDVLDGEWRRTVLLGAIFPTHVMQLQPDWLWYLQISPIGTDRVRIRWEVSVAPEMLAAQTDPDAYIANVLDLLNLVNSEDKPIVEGVRRGVATPGAPRGQLSIYERNVFDFDRYIARSLSVRS